MLEHSDNKLLTLLFIRRLATQAEFESSKKGRKTDSL